MAQFPIAIQAFPLSSGASDLTYWRSDFISGAWTTPALIFDLGATPTFFYNQTAGATSDGTKIGVCIAHGNGSVDASTLESVGDGPPDPVYDVSAGNTITTPAQDQSTGEFLYNGNWYEIVTNLSAPNVYVRKSTNNRATWTILDPTHSPSGTVTDPILFTIVTRNSAVRRSLIALNKIDLFCTNFGGGDSFIFLYTFDLNTGLWTGPYGGQLLAGQSIGNGYDADEAFWRFSNCVVRFPNGDIAGFYSDNSSGQLSYRIFNGVSWGAAINIPNLFNEKFFQVIIDDGDPETIHLITLGATGLGHPHRYFTCTHTGVVTLRYSFPLPVGPFGGLGHGTSIGGTLYVPLTDSNDVGNAVYSGATGGALSKMPLLPVPAPDVGLSPNAGAYMVDWFVASGPPIIDINLTFNLKGFNASGSPGGLNLVSVNPPPPGPGPGPIVNPTQCIEQT